MGFYSGWDNSNAWGVFVSLHWGPEVLATTPHSSRFVNLFFLGCGA